MTEIKDNAGNVMGYSYAGAHPQDHGSGSVIEVEPETGETVQEYFSRIGEPMPQRPLIPAVFRYPATTEELVEYGRDFFGDCLSIAKQRNERYATYNKPFKNFQLAGEYGIAVRMSDKVSRLLTLTTPGTNIEGGPESIEDTCKDLANYAMLLSALRSYERGG
jgi:hypothetical protein